MNWSSLSSGGQGALDVVTLPMGGDSGSAGAARAPSGFVNWSASVLEDLRERIDGSTAAAQSYTRVVYDSGQASQPGLVIGKQVNDPNGEPYQLYYLPAHEEEESLSLVRGTLATAGLFVVVLLGAIAWLVVRQVVTPVRMAASIAERLSAGRLQERMKVTGEDDIARLGEAFNKMAQNLQLKISQLEDPVADAAAVRLRRVARAADAADDRAHGRRRHPRRARGLRSGDRAVGRVARRPAGPVRDAAR